VEQGWCRRIQARYQIGNNNRQEIGRGPALVVGETPTYWVGRGENMTNERSKHLNINLTNQTTSPFYEAASAVPRDVAHIVKLKILCIRDASGPFGSWRIKIRLYLPVSLRGIICPCTLGGVTLRVPRREPVGIHAEGAAKPEGVCGVSTGIGKPLLERLRLLSN